MRGKEFNLEFSYNNCCTYGTEKKTTSNEMKSEIFLMHEIRYN